jgi:hypothetical protein
MRKPAWIGHRVMQTPRQRWSFALITVSVLGTLLAGFSLALDGWVDALALYAACVLLLALMLGHYAGQQMQPRLVAFADDGRADLGACPASLVLTGAPSPWAGADRSAIPVTLGNTASMD